MFNSKDDNNHAQVYEMIRDEDVTANFTLPEVRSAAGRFASASEDAETLNGTRLQRVSSNQLLADTYENQQEVETTEHDVSESMNFMPILPDQDTYLSQRTASVLKIGNDKATWMLRQSITPADLRAATDVADAGIEVDFTDSGILLDDDDNILLRSIRYMENASVEASLVDDNTLDQNTTESNSSVVKLETRCGSTHDTFSESIDYAISSNLGENSEDEGSDSLEFHVAEDLTINTSHLESLGIDSVELASLSKDDTKTQIESTTDCNSPQRRRSYSSSRINSLPICNEQSISQILSNYHILESLEQKINTDSSVEQESCLLYRIFEGFSQPEISQRHCEDILRIEREKLYNQSESSVQFPEQPVIVQLPMASTDTSQKLAKCRVIKMLQAVSNNSKSKVIFLQLPVYFSAAFFRILIRLLSHETDKEYNEACLLSLPSKNERTIDLNTVPTLDPDHATLRPHLQYSAARIQCNWLASTLRLSEHKDDRPAIQALLNLWERLANSPPHFYHRLIGPVSRLIGLMSTAGVTPRILRRIISLCSQQQQQSTFTSSTSSNQYLLSNQQSLSDTNTKDHFVFARICLVRALKSGIVGASRSKLLPKSAPLHYFSFGGHFDQLNSVSESCLQRTINGITVWPFRNDFGMALWFRAERFPRSQKHSDRVILFSVRTEQGGGIEISLVPIDDDVEHSSSPSNVRTLAVSIYDSDPSMETNTKSMAPNHYLKARGGCVLIPQVWYHVAVRHTRSRLKGVFSLSTRQQLSIMLDGKTLITEPLNFPAISDTEISEDSFYTAHGATSLIKNSFRRNVAVPATINITLRFGQNLDGQAGSLYIFHENISDASFRSLYEFTGGFGGSKKRSPNLSDTWDSRQRDFVRKSRLLDVNVVHDDAEEVVMSKRRLSGNRESSEKLESVLDLGDSDEQDESELPLELQNAAFGSKIFICWNPRRIYGGQALELHVGAHVHLGEVYPWTSTPIQNLIGTLGGMQCLIPLFRSFVAGDVERGFGVTTSLGINGTAFATKLSETLYRIIPDLINLLSSFVYDHSVNARELLRCGGIDVIEQLLYMSKKIGIVRGGQPSVFASLNSHPSVACDLVEALLSLLSASANCIGLETKVYSRLLFNIPLWLGGIQQIHGVALHVTLLPVLSTLAKLNPEKVRDCVGVKDIVHSLREYTVENPSDLAFPDCSSLDRFEVMPVDEQSSQQPMNAIERHHAVNILLTMIFIMLSQGTSPTDLAPFLQFISFNLESEWEAYLLKGQQSEEKSVPPNETNVTWCACTALLFLLQVRPCVPGLYESFASCCGGVQSGAGWILCSLVHSYDDEIRGIGIRCLAEYLDITSRGPDFPLSLGSLSFPSAPTTAHPVVDVTSMVRRSSKRISQLAKGIAAMSPGVRAVILTPSRLTTRVVYKLLWHLLKSRRSYLGSFTRSALLCWITVEERSEAGSDIASLGFVRNRYVTPIQRNKPGFHFNLELAKTTFAEASINGRIALRNPLAISMILRVLRFLDNSVKDQWLQDLLLFSESNRKCVALLASLPDWQACLFLLISETVENVVSSRKDPKSFDENAGLANSQSPQIESAILDASFGADLLHTRLDRCLKLYSTLLGHLVREGGEHALEAVERTASLERTCVNGHDVLLLVLGSLCSNIFEYGSLLETGSLSAQDWKDVDLEHDSPLLKQSARLVTDAILSNGTKGLDMPAAVRSWRSLRHLTEVIVAVVTKSGFGVTDLFDYAYQQASSVDNVSGGFHGIRLPETKLTGVSAAEYSLYAHAATSVSWKGENSKDAKKSDVDRRLCVRLAAQILNLLDAFIFPQSLDNVLPMDSISLVRNPEVRLGTSQGPLISSGIRLSFLILALVEPCSVVFLQCVSRLRCLLCWALELVREASATEGSILPFHKEGTAHLDRLLLSLVLHSHRSLGRCASLLAEIESSSFDKYFQSRETQKKCYRRLLRVGLELREVVSTAYRGRNDYLRSTLSSDAFDCLRDSLEGSSSAIKPSSKESVVREFLTSTWVSAYQDCESKSGLVIPEQVSMHSIPLSSRQENQPGLQGFVAVERLALESGNMVSEFEKAIDVCFKEYLEEHQRWTETDAVRDLEYEGDLSIKRFSETYKIQASDISRVLQQRRGGADYRWKSIQKKVVDPWKNETHWKLARYPDHIGRRILFVPNPYFEDHHDASYDLTHGNERKTAQEGLIQKDLLESNALSDVMRRNTEAFIPADKDMNDTRDDDSTIPISDSESVTTDAESSAEASADTDSVDEFKDPELMNIKTVVKDNEQDEGWDKIDTDEIGDVDTEGDLDAWAKTFIWSENETTVARFDSVMIVTLQTLVEGHALLTTHCLYFHQTKEEIGIVSREPVSVNDTSTSFEGKYRRWRLARLTEVHGRRFLLRQQALELFFADNNELFLNFPEGVRDRDRFFTKLRHNCKVPMLWSIRSLNPRLNYKRSRYTEMWRKRKISNFEYLMILNRMAGRSFNDLTQYPVFPWVIADYTSETIDLTDSRVYRDLSKPIGAINPDRLAQLLERYNDLETFGFTEAEKFLYGSHYSSPGIVLHYLIRQEPFTTLAIDLQSGRFDCPDRLFFSISESWNSCLTSTSDMKELIPEFFTLPEMFLNTNQFPLGRTQVGRLVDNVSLPPWAKGSAYEFVRINRLALESENVSQNLHKWIDLIFGYKQRGPEATRSHNIFHHFSYEGSVDLDKIVDDIDRKAAETHIQNFGQTPCQLLVDDPHPCRYSAEESWKPLFSETAGSRHLRFYTPVKQFVNRSVDEAKGACLKIHVFSDTVIVLYEDLNVGTYRWHASHKTNRLRMEKLRSLSRKELSKSKVAMKRGSAINSFDSSTTTNKNNFVDSSCFAVTLGGLVKEELRRKAVLPSGRLISTNETSLAAAEGSALLLSCGYWDDTVKAHTADSWRLVASETGGHSGPIRCMAISQDGCLMATGGMDCTCRVWVVDHHDMVVALSDGYTQTAYGVPNDGDRILRCCHVLWGHDSPITSIAVDSELDVVVSGCAAGVICVHTLRRGEFIRCFRLPSVSRGTSTNRNASPGMVSKLVMGNDGAVVVQMEDNGLHTSTVNGVILRSIDAGERLHDMIISTSGETLVTGGDRGQVVIRNVYDLQICSVLDLSRHGPIRCITLTPAELNPITQYAFVGSDDGMITVIENDPVSRQRNNQTISF